MNISENIKNILNEEYHVSNDVLKMCEKIIKDFIEKFHKSKWLYDKDIIELNYTNEPIFNIVRRVIVIITNYDDENEIKMLDNSTFNGYDIIVEVSCVNEKLDIYDVKKNILHELEHVYQKHKTLSNNSIYRISNLYHIALNNIHSDNDITKTISTLLYNLNQKESDAHLHEYYYEYKLYYKNGMIPNKSNSLFIGKMQSTFDLYDKYLSFERNDEFNSILKNIFHRTDGQLRFYFEHGIQYIKVKMKNVEKKVIKDLNTPTLEEKLKKINKIRPKDTIFVL